MARPAGTFNTATRAPGLQQVWQAMRVMRRFTSGQLITVAEAGESAVHKYLRALLLTGFIRIDRPIVSGRPGSFNVYQLVRDSGPHAPIRRTKGGVVFDRNTRLAYGPGGQVIPTKTKGGA